MWAIKKILQIIIIFGCGKVKQHDYLKSFGHISCRQTSQVAFFMIWDINFLRAKLERIVFNIQAMDR